LPIKTKAPVFVHACQRVKFAYNNCRKHRVRSRSIKNKKVQGVAQVSYDNSVDRTENLQRIAFSEISEKKVQCPRFSIRPLSTFIVRWTRKVSTIRIHRTYKTIGTYIGDQK
jgi:hypothetical protein